MRVALGTIDIDETTRKKLGKAINGRQYLKRDEARDWALSTVWSAITAATGSNPAPSAEQQAALEPLPEPAPAVAPTVSGPTTTA
jgi:hypothetical protein